MSMLSIISGIYGYILLELASELRPYKIWRPTRCQHVVLRNFSRVLGVNNTFTLYTVFETYGYYLTRFCIPN